jgi:hypothetical protein
MACGSGRYLADLMAGVMPHISSEGLDISRYEHRMRPGQKRRETFEVDSVACGFRAR